MIRIVKDRWGDKHDGAIFKLLRTPEGPIAVVKKGVFPIVRLEDGTEAMFPKCINGMRATCPKEEQHD